jgi:hypothetical protein
MEVRGGGRKAVAAVCGLVDSIGYAKNKTNSLDESTIPLLIESMVLDPMRALSRS